MKFKIEDRVEYIAKCVKYCDGNHNILKIKTGTITSTRKRNHPSILDIEIKFDKSIYENVLIHKWWCCSKGFKKI